MATDRRADEGCATSEGDAGSSCRQTFPTGVPSPRTESAWAEEPGEQYVLLAMQRLRPDGQPLRQVVCALNALGMRIRPHAPAAQMWRCVITHDVAFS